jgi:hypothetical protein
MLDLLGPHFVSFCTAAHNRRVLAALEASEHSPRCVVVVGGDGLIDFAGPDRSPPTPPLLRNRRTPSPARPAAGVVSERIEASPCEDRVSPTKSSSDGYGCWRPLGRTPSEWGSPHA